ncbi:MAG TPA: glucoamylase family protein [Elusimicrobiota bacterium]|nr:glucoamylase family protein [Elusimicrobiota bacterium]
MTPTLSSAQSRPSVSAEDAQYLTDLARDTWACLDALVHPQTGLPYDNNDPARKYTSVSNIGLYAADLAGAVELGLLPRDEARKRAEKLLASLEKFKHWKGFCQSWNNLETLSPSPEDPWISVLDSGNLAGGLLVIKQAFPELRDRAGKYLDAMDWSAFYDPATHTLYGGANMTTGALNKDWKLNLLGSDSRLASFLAIGAGKIAPAHWDTLSRGMETRYGLDYLAPGWQGGGLFMQYISGLFVDEEGTLPGLSAARFAYVQMLHAQLIQSPAWGWSASDSPKDGYLGWQAIQDKIVTPHASALPLRFFPRECVANLRRLEQSGARAPTMVNGTPKKYGFRDALDVTTAQVTDTYLMLDQSMLFLSIVNALKDGAIYKYAAKDPSVQKARERIADYQGKNLRREEFWKELASLAPRGLTLSLRTLETTTDFAPGEKTTVPVFSVGKADPASRLLWRVMDAKTGRYGPRGETSWPAAEIRFKSPAADGLYLFQAAIFGPGGRAATEDSFTFRVSPPGAAARKEPVEDLPAVSWQDHGANWRARPPVAGDDWTVNTAPAARAGATKVGPVVQLTFSFPKGEWVEMGQNLVDPSRLKRITFLHRCSGTPARLEIKFVDTDGTVFGQVRPLRPAADWQAAVVDLSRLKHFWGGNGVLNTAEGLKLFFAVSGPDGGNGALEIKSLQGHFEK